MAAAAPADRRKEDIIRVSSDLAAADAAHDFSGARGTPAAQSKLKALAAKLLGGGASVPVFKRDLYARDVGIGTVHLPTYISSRDIHDEWGTFTMVTGKTKAELLAVDEQTFKTGEDFDYVCTRKVIHGAGRAWTQTAKELFDWLVAKTPDQNNLYFCIDAVNVKFYEIFEDAAQNSGAAEKARTLHYLNYREGINDSAGKPSLEYLVAATAAKPVKVRTYEDNAVGHILYPHYSPDTKDLPNSQFNSIFSITVKNEKQADGIKSTLTSFFSQKFSSSIQVVKGRKEEHPNAVNSLFPRLIQAFKEIFQVRGKGTPEQRFKFFQTLHQKRSGDWFQVLAPDDTSRFVMIGADGRPILGADGKPVPVIPEGSTVVLFTEDIIAAAYAALTGKNVCLTTVDEAGNGTLILLLRTKPAGTAEEILRAKILAFETFFLEKDVRNFKHGDGAPVALQSIADIFNKTYMTTENAIKERIEIAKTALTKWVDDSTKQGIRVVQLKANKELKDKIRDLLRELFELASFYNYIQPLPDTATVIAEVNNYVKLFDALKGYRDGLAGAAPVPQLTEAGMNQLRLIHSLLLAIQAKIHLYVDAAYTNTLVGGYAEALNRAMSKLFTVGPASSQKQKHRNEMNKIIDSFLLFDTLFQRSNSSTNSIALFQFLSTIPDKIYLTGVKKYLDSTLTKIRVLVGGAVSEEKHLDTFKKTFGFLTLGNAIEVLGRDEAPEADILQCILEHDDGDYINIKANEDEEEAPDAKKQKPAAAAPGAVAAPAAAAAPAPEVGEAAAAGAAAPRLENENDDEGEKLTREQRKAQAAARAKAAAEAKAKAAADAKENAAAAAPAVQGRQKRQRGQRGGDTTGLEQGRIEFLYSLFTPSLRILAGQAAEVFARGEDAFHAENRFIERLAAGGGGGAGAGNAMNSEGEEEDEEENNLPGTPPPLGMNNANHGGGRQETIIGLSLHPLTYVFFYVRECLLQLEVESSDYKDWIRIGQLLNLYKDIFKRTPAKLRKSPFAERIYYGTLAQILLGWAPQTVKDGHREIKKFRKALGLSDATLASLTGSVNESYFGQHSFQLYRVSNPSKLQRNIFRNIRKALTYLEPVTSESRLYNELEDWIHEIPSTVDACIQGEQKDIQTALYQSQKRPVSKAREVVKEPLAGIVGVNGGGTRRRGRKRGATRLNSRRRIRK